jgi:methionine sulfoxide reductase heme-binding subunit
MLIAAVSSSPKALWYLTRGTGLVSLLLLSLTMVLGLAQVTELVPPGLPRYVATSVHRNASLLAVAFLGVHILTAVLDSFVPTRLIDAFLPFAAAYRPIWVGFGTLAFDLLLALVVTSLVRTRLGLGAWRAVHWAAYACWPLAMVHGLGTGSDSRFGWAIWLYIICAVAVLASLAWRIGRGWSLGERRKRLLAGGATVVFAALVAAWAASGPLRPGWSRRAGNVGSLVGAGVPAQPASLATNERPLPTSPSTEAETDNDSGER